MRKIKTLMLMASFALMSTYTFAGFIFDFFNPGQGNGGSGGGAVGAPLDGGILAILAAAGITYFAARKKKKNQ